MADCCISETGIEEYAQKLKSQAPRVPLSGTIELTHRCNNRCAHCYVGKPANDHMEIQSELDYTEICAILDNIASAGCLWLLLTGGEPLLREDFEDIYLYAKKKGFLITLFTNGTLVTPSLADLLVNFPPRFIEISVYGASKPVYEAMTRSPGSFEKCLKGIHLLLDRNLPLKLKTIITTINHHEFMDIKELVENLGLDFRFDALINARVDGKEPVTELRVSPKRVVELDLTEPKRREGFLAHYEKVAQRQIDFNSVYRCGAGINSFHIDPHGRLAMCSMSRVPYYDLRSGTFQEGWNDLFPQIRAKQSRRNTRCSSCRLISICEQCAGWSQLEHGDPEIPVDFLCEVTRMRAEAYGIPS
jgi:radical SAM protein with 4Fe4S-binding SPASM domain